MEAQTRQDDRGGREAGGAANAHGGATPPELAEPKAWGGYLKQNVNPRSLGETGLMSGEQEPAAWAVAGPYAVPVALPEATGLDLVHEEFVPEPEEPDPPKAGVIFQPRFAEGNRAPIASLASSSAELAITVPPHDVVQFAPELSRPGMVATQGPVACEVETAVAVAHFPPVAFESTCVLPAHPFEIRTSIVPAAASDPVRLDASPVAPPEAELRWESAVSFEFLWRVSESLEPGWVNGLELASSEERLAEALLANAQPLDAAEEIAGNAAVESDTAVESAAEPEVEAIAEPGVGALVEVATPPEQEAVEARTPVESILASATPEPVIDVNMLWSLFGKNEEPAPAAKAEPAAEPTSEPEPAIMSAAEEPVERPVEEPMATVEEAQESAPEESVAGGKSAGPQEAGSFLPVTIRPAGPPSKSRLMQSFQAIALVSANPQIPAWNMLPLRPKMTLGKAPPPGSTASAKSGSASDARNGGSAVAVATAPAEESNTDVPMFGSLAKPRSGLSKWFKLGIAIGVISIAGGMYRPAGTGGSGRVARAREYMTTEFAVCRN